MRRLRLTPASGPCHVCCDPWGSRDPSAWASGAYRYEVVPIESQNWITPRARIAAGPVCAFFRALPRCHSAGSAHCPISTGTVGHSQIDGGGVTEAAVRQQQPSSDHDSGQSPVDPCAICATMALANTVLFATPPALLLPSADAEFAYRLTETEFVRLNTVIAFQPRGPPAS